MAEAVQAQGARTFSPLLAQLITLKPCLSSEGARPNGRLTATAQGRKVPFRPVTNGLKPLFLV